MANKERLIQLAEVLESERAEKHFNMNTWFANKRYERPNKPMGIAIQDCGTIACIGGWAEVIANADLNWTDKQIEANKWLDLTYAESDKLFYPVGYFGVNNPKLAAKVVRHFAETGEVDWSIIDADLEAEKSDG